MARTRGEASGMIQTRYDVLRMERADERVTMSTHEASEATLIPDFLRRFGRYIERSALTHSSHRLLTLLIFLPPTMGAILGGASVRLVGMGFFGLPVQRPEMDISVGMVVCAFTVLFFLWRRSLSVYRGSPSAFPRAFRAVPWTSLAGLALGLAGALNQVLRG